MWLTSKLTSCIPTVTFVLGSDDSVCHNIGFAPSLMPCGKTLWALRRPPSCFCLFSFKITIVIHKIPLLHASYIPAVLPNHDDGKAYLDCSESQLMMFLKWHWAWTEERKPFSNLSRKVWGLSSTLQRLCRVQKWREISSYPSVKPVILLSGHVKKSVTARVWSAFWGGSVEKPSGQANTG